MDLKHFPVEPLITQFQGNNKNKLKVCKSRLHFYLKLDLNGIISSTALKIYHIPKCNSSSLSFSFVYQIKILATTSDRNSVTRKYVVHHRINRSKSLLVIFKVNWA